MNKFSEFFCQPSGMFWKALREKKQPFAVFRKFSPGKKQAYGHFHKFYGVSRKFYEEKIERPF